MQPECVETHTHTHTHVCYRHGGVSADHPEHRVVDAPYARGAFHIRLAQYGRRTARKREHLTHTRHLREGRGDVGERSNENEGVCGCRQLDRMHGREKRSQQPTYQTDLETRSGKLRLNLFGRLVGWFGCWLVGWLVV